MTNNTESTINMTPRHPSISTVIRIVILKIKYHKPSTEAALPVEDPTPSEPFDENAYLAGQVIFLGGNPAAPKTGNYFQGNFMKEALDLTKTI